MSCPCLRGRLPATQVASLKEAANAEGTDLRTAYNKLQGRLTAQQVICNHLQSPHFQAKYLACDMLQKDIA